MLLDSIIKKGYTQEEAQEICKVLLKYPDAEVCTKDSASGMLCLPKQELDEWEW